MAITNNIKELITFEFLQPRLCSKCDKNFQEVEYMEDNYLVFFRTNHRLQAKLFPPNDYRGFVGLELQLQHKECDKVYPNDKILKAKRELNPNQSQQEVKTNDKK